MTEKKMTIMFAEGVLESMEEMMSPEELQQFIDDLQAKVDDGTIFEESQPVDLEKLQREDPLEYELLMAQLERTEDDDAFVDHRTLN